MQQYPYRLPGMLVIRPSSIAPKMAIGYDGPAGVSVIKIMTKQKPQFDPTRPISWSALSCFDNPDYPEYSDPEEWYRRYVLGIKSAPTKQLLFGGMVDKKIQADRTFLPELERFPIMQFEMKPVYKKIPLIGFADGWDFDRLRLKDDKTGVKPWDQKRADKTGQLTMYLFMIYLMHGIHPEKVKCRIDWIPTVQHADLSIDFAKPLRFHSIHTTRSMSDILKFAAYIERTVKAMKKYAENHE